MAEARASQGKRVSLPTGASHTITVVSSVSRVRLVGLFFDLNKCFLLPSAMHGIRAIKQEYDAHPGGKVLVVGHTDTSGKDAYNLSLSVERADAVAAYLSDAGGAWETFFAANKPDEKRWGTREVQHMLSALPEGGAAFYSGTPNGALDAKHKDAVRRFQAAQGLQVDGVAGPDTRRALIREYMALDGTTLPTGTSLVTHGCGENFPVDETGDGVRSAENRRVEIFFFDDPITPPPPAAPGNTSARGSRLYPQWLAQVDKTIDVVLGTASTVASLQSRYALERFEKFAAAIAKDEFVAWASMTYGADIPLSAYRALHTDLLNTVLVPPEIQLAPGGIDGKDSAYDDATQEIAVREEIALAAETDTNAAGQLIVLLMHEFGHHVDHQLRHHYSTVGGDARGEEATLFSYAVSGMHHVQTDHVPFATLVRDGQSIELALDFPEFFQATKKYLSDTKAQDEAKRNNVEFFGAGTGNPKFPNASFGHRSIEFALGPADPTFFNQGVRDQIYFGNWLRDFSQFNDPIWLQFFTNRFFNAVKQARDVMAESLDLAAKSEFEPIVTPSTHVAGAFHVTTAKLGVYRPEEHIDNPQGILDGSAVDPLFHGRVSPAEIAIDPSTGMKAYIATRGQGFRTSSEFIEKSLRDAVTAGKTPEGRRLFGQALHTLEDLYAHSNFSELTFIRLGHTSVYPWVGAATGITVTRNGKPQPRIPLVTGTFGWVDTGVSVGSVFGEVLDKPIECKAGEFSAASVAVLKLIEAVTPDGGHAIESLFSQLHELEKKYEPYATFLCRATDSVRDWIRSKIGTAMREEIKQLGIAEKAFFDDPKSTAPTHSQLAKDHDDHPLHAITAQCAQAMVADVGLAMRDAWNGVITADALVQRALRYLVHPDDVNLAQTTGPGKVVRLLKAFADANSAVIKSLDLPTSKARFLGGAHAQREQQLGEARTMFANNEQNADRTIELVAIV